MKTALICGATGLVGGECLKLLVEDVSYDSVVVLTRRPVTLVEDDGKVTQHLIDFAELLRHRDRAAADHVFCALGTTIRKAGSRKRFREVDYGYPLELAEMTRSSGASHFSLVTSFGANANSRVFYSRVKGEIEQAIPSLDFPSVAIFRPSVLSGPRSEFRLGERFALALAKLAPPKYRATPAASVARAMVAAAKEARPGCHTFEASDIHEFDNV